MQPQVVEDNNKISQPMRDLLLRAKSAPPSAPLSAETTDGGMWPSRSVAVTQNI